jgi:hypothetical protein
MSSFAYAPGGLLSLLRLAEPPPLPVSEADLSTIWAGQRFPAEALRTADGRSVRVVFPGRANGGAGPDFQDAVIEIGGVERRGDIELHVRASGFRGHGHDRDAAYDALVLHVVYLGVDAALRAAGEARFAARGLRFKEQLDTLGANESLWRALIDQLGVGGDRDGFRRFSDRFSLAVARAVGGQLELAMLTVAGLATPTADLAARLPAPLSPPIAVSGRPANAPARRLQALARLFARANGELATYAVAGVRDVTRVRELVAAWTVSGEPALIGEMRARELVLNAVLPFVSAREPALSDKALALAAQLPAAGTYGKTRFLETNLRRADGRRRVRGALSQQGLLALLSEWCSRGGCGRCPLS